MDPKEDFEPDRAPSSLEEARETEYFPSWADAPTASGFTHPGEPDSPDSSPLAGDAQVSDSSFPVGGADDEPDADAPPPPPKHSRVASATPAAERAAKKQRNETGTVAGAGTNRRNKVLPPAPRGKPAPFSSDLFLLSS